MNNRERFAAAMAFEPIDRMCHMEWGIWGDTMTRWKQQGLPPHVVQFKKDCLSDEIEIFEYLGVMREETLPLEGYFIPPFIRRTIEETDDYIIESNERGVTLKQNKRNMSIPEFLKYPMKDRKDYETLKERLHCDVAARYPKNWQEMALFLREQKQNVVRIFFDGFFGYPREIMGLVQFLYNLHDDPDLVKDIINDRVNFYIRMSEKAIREARPDYAFIWEDMSYKNGPLISPDMFKEFMLPAYKKFISYLKGMGIRIIMVDSDGDISKLIPLWIEGGVTALLPFEVMAGMDVIEVAKQYPKLQILGGIDKLEIAKGKKAIDAELKRVLPYMAKRGGYCATLDHHIHPQIDLDTYQYYTEQITKFRLI